MAKRRNAHCRWCLKHRDEVGPISKTGACATCGRERMIASIEDQVAGEGPVVQHWQKKSREAYKRFAKTR